VILTQLRLLQKPKDNKDWMKMSKADWDKLENEAEGPGEPWKVCVCACVRECVRACV
jgi:hypothetical protein